MAQVTTLQPTALPGKIKTFSAKDAAALAAQFTQYATKFSPPYSGRQGLTDQYIGTYDISSGNVTLINLRVYYVPIQIPYTIHVDRISVNITTGDSGKIANLGIYSIERGIIDSIIYSDTISLTNTGVVEAVINTVLSPGTYALVYFDNSGSTAVKKISMTTNILGYVINNPTVQYTHYYENHGSFDDLEDTPTVILATGDAPHIMLRLK